MRRSSAHPELDYVDGDSYESMMEGLGEVTVVTG
jgi:hypothetical protein